MIVFNHVDFDRDLAGIKPVLKGAYEKANIWPAYKDDVQALEILSEEVEEAFEHVNAIDEIYVDEDCETLCKVDINFITNIEGHAISAICELLQVLAVCKKMRQMLERGAK